MQRAPADRAPAPPAKSPAPPPGKPAPDPAAAKLYARHLARARALAKRKQYHPAIEKYAAALEAWPDQPEALLELGQAALATGDLDTADGSIRAALAAAEEAGMQAAIHHQLGVIAERRGDKPGAIKAGTESLRLREDAAVRQWLTRLQGDARPPAR
jgi:tetratricopeptide (TPR) repeat protein